MVIIIFRRIVMDIVIFLPVNVAHPGTLLLVRVGLESGISGSLVPTNILAVPDVVLTQEVSIVEDVTVFKTVLAIAHDAS